MPHVKMLLLFHISRLKSDGLLIIGLLISLALKISYPVIMSCFIFSDVFYVSEAAPLIKVQSSCCMLQAEQCSRTDLYHFFEH